MIKDCCAKYVIPAVECERETGSIVLQEKKSDADTIDLGKLGWCLGMIVSRIAAKSDRCDDGS